MIQSGHLDRPIRSILTGRQAYLAQGDARAVRIDRDYGPFGAASDTSAAAQAALAALFLKGQRAVAGRRRETWPLPPGTHEVKRAILTQMVAEGPPPEPRADDPLIVPLGEADAAEMTTRPSMCEAGAVGAEDISAALSSAYAKRGACLRWRGNGCLFPAWRRSAASRPGPIAAAADWRAR